MKRITEPELMDDREQAKAYANADFEDANSRFLASFKEGLVSSSIKGYVLDLGCGPADISFRVAREFSECIVHGVDGSEAMLKSGRDRLQKEPDLAGRIELICGFLPGAALPRTTYDAVISNSLLHHLHDPGVLWEVVGTYASPGAPVFVMDLMRPDTVEDARELVELHSAEEPEVLKEDFYNSLLAAFTPEEIRGQLKNSGLDNLSVTMVSDRHVVISGVR